MSKNGDQPSKPINDEPPSKPPPFPLKPITPPKPKEK